jgi:hypothetical protein
MARSSKVNRVITRTHLRKSTLTANPAARRPFPAWIDASDRQAPFPARTAHPRLRDSLVLRRISKQTKKKSAGAKGTHHDPGAR